MHQVINDEILTIIRTILTNIEIQNKENGKDYSEDVKNPEGKEVIVEKEHEELYKDLISFRELFTYKNEERNNYIYKNEEGKELGIYLPKIVDGDKDDVLGKITERFNAIESKFNKLTFTDNDKKQNIKKQLDNYKELLSEKNKVKIIESIAAKTNEGPEQNEPQTPVPTSEPQTTDRRKKVVKKENWLEKIENATVGKLDALTQDNAWSEFKKNVGSKALKFGVKFLLPVAGGASLLVIAQQTIAAIGGVGTVALAGGAASLAPMIPPLISLAGIAGVIGCSVALAKRRKRRIKEREEAEREEREFLEEQNNTQEQQQTAQENLQDQIEDENIIEQQEPQVAASNLEQNTTNEEHPIITNNSSNDVTEQDILIQLRDKKQEVIETKMAMEIEKQKDNSDPVVQASQQLATTQHEKSKHEFVRMILENIDIKELEQEESHSITM